MTGWTWVLVGVVAVCSAALALVVRAFLAPVVPLGKPTSDEARVTTEALEKASLDAASDVQATRKLTTAGQIARARELAAKGRK